MNAAPPTRRQRVLARTVLSCFSWASTRTHADDVVRPRDDAFYAQVPTTGRHGTPLDVRRAVLPGRRPFLHAAWNVRFASTDAADAELAGVATVIRPSWNRRGAQPIVSFQPAINSLSDRGAPSYRLRLGNFIDLPFVGRLLRRGWGVIITDYAGPRWSYGIGELSGRLVLDGIDAALDADLGLDRSAPLGLWGYSGGAAASLWAAELAATYTPGLRLSAVAAGGTPVNLRSVLEAADGGMYSGMAIAALIGLCREHPQVDLEASLSTEGRHVYTALQDTTTDEAAAAFPFASISDLIEGGSLDAVPGLGPVLDGLLDERRTPQGALYLYHPIRDQLCPLELAACLAGHYRRQGKSVEFAPIPAVDHMLGIPAGAPGAVRFLSTHLEPNVRS